MSFASSSLLFETPMEERIRLGKVRAVPSAEGEGTDVVLVLEENLESEYVDVALDSWGEHLFHDPTP